MDSQMDTPMDSSPGLKEQRVAKEKEYKCNGIPKEIMDTPWEGRAAGHQRNRMQMEWEPKGNNGDNMGRKSNERATGHQRKGMQTQWEPKGNNGYTMGRKSNERETGSQLDCSPDRAGGYPIAPHIETQLHLTWIFPQIEPVGTPWSPPSKTSSISHGFSPDRAGGYPIEPPIKNQLDLEWIFQ